MPPSRLRIVVGLLVAGALIPSNVVAQDQVAVRADVLMYGDNTEFRNPFREGETIFGAAVRLAASVDLDRATLSLGGFANQRFGSENAFEQVRPVISLTVRGDRSAFIFGTLPPPTISGPVGPDRAGPHALLPPLQRETLAYDRPYEAGLEWRFTGTTLRNDFWLEWQRVNTPEHRERFDGGFNGSVRLSAPVSLPYQLHVVR